MWGSRARLRAAAPCIHAIHFCHILECSPSLSSVPYHIWCVALVLDISPPIREFLKLVAGKLLAIHLYRHILLSVESTFSNDKK